MTMSNSSYYDYHPTLQLERPVVLGGMPGTPYREVGHYLTSLTGLPLLDLERLLGPFHLALVCGRALRPAQG